MSLFCLLYPGVSPLVRDVKRLMTKMEHNSAEYASCLNNAISVFNLRNVGSVSFIMYFEQRRRNFSLPSAVYAFFVRTLRPLGHVTTTRVDGRWFLIANWCLLSTWIDYFWSWTKKSKKSYIWTNYPYSAYFVCAKLSDCEVGEQEKSTDGQEKIAMKTKQHEIRWEAVCEDRNTHALRWRVPRTFPLTTRN